MAIVSEIASKKRPNHPSLSSLVISIDKQLSKQLKSRLNDREREEKSRQQTNQIPLSTTSEEFTKRRETLQVRFDERGDPSCGRRSGIIFLIRLCRGFRFTVEGLARYCVLVYDSPIRAAAATMAGLRFANEPINPSFTNTNLHARDAGVRFRGFELLPLRQIRIMPVFQRKDSRNHPSSRSRNRWIRWERCG